MNKAEKTGTVTAFAGLASYSSIKPTSKTVAVPAFSGSPEPLRKFIYKLVSQ
jgi:hypothetical protein